MENHSTLVPNNLKITTNNFYSMPSFYFNYENIDNEVLHTMFTKLMLEEKYLATNYMFISFAHTDEKINKYLKSCDKVFFKISKFLKTMISKNSKTKRRLTY